MKNIVLELEKELEKYKKALQICKKQRDHYLQKHANEYGVSSSEFDEAVKEENEEIDKLWKNQ